MSEANDPEEEKTCRLIPSVCFDKSQRGRIDDDHQETSRLPARRDAFFVDDQLDGHPSNGPGQEEIIENNS